MAPRSIYGLHLNNYERLFLSFISVRNRICTFNSNYATCIVCMYDGKSINLMNCYTKIFCRRYFQIGWSISWWRWEKWKSLFFFSADISNETLIFRTVREMENEKRKPWKVYNFWNLTNKLSVNTDASICKR